MNRRILLGATISLLVGAGVGYATLAAGPIAVILGVIALALLLARLREGPQQIGSYSLGVGVTGGLIALRVMLAGRACAPGVVVSCSSVQPCNSPACYAASTVLAFVVYVVVALLGGFLVARAFQQGRFIHQ